MADFEDANSPTWQNMIEGQLNLRDALDHTITYSNPDGKLYTLKENVAVLMVGPRGWHLPEKHVLLDGQTISGSLFDFGLYMFHNAHKLIKKGTGPYFYLPKLEITSKPACGMMSLIWRRICQASCAVQSAPRC